MKAKKPRKAQQPKDEEPFISAGRQRSQIGVRISYRIIQLFSEGLYSTPHKAIEELVSNAFDAGANNVHVLTPPDPKADDATIAVIDDGEGMDAKGLRQHWIIGVSDKRSKSRKGKRRSQIGKFGIGKLATYVLSNRLTHICKRDGVYYATSMDFTKIPSGQGIHAEKPVRIPLRVLTEEQAKAAVRRWTEGTGAGHKALRLFGKDAVASWTVAIMSGLKDMASEIVPGRLSWVLQTAMPLRDDFKLFLNGQEQPPAKLRGKRVDTWTLGKNLVSIPKPADEDFYPSEDQQQDPKSPARYGLTHPILGRVFGYAEVFEDLLTAGKSKDIERSHGFFVYVRGRLINIDDEYFGIDSNLLRHGTFSRFRLVIHVDKLDDELRSSRESVRTGTTVKIVQNLLHGIFNHARVAHQKHEGETSSGAQMARRLSGTPGSLTRRPLFDVVVAALEGKIQPRFVSVPTNLTATERTDFIDTFRDKIEDPDGLVTDVQLVDISQEAPLAVYNATSGQLHINQLHPFVAYFFDDYTNRQHRLPLELLAVSEVLMEAHLYQTGIAEETVADILQRRDELLRYLARSTGKRNALVVSQDLVNASTNKDALERELVAAFDSMGFNAVPLGGQERADGRAEAHLAAVFAGRAKRYAISLEAKSKERDGARVSSKMVSVSAIARQRDQEECDHAVIVGPAFATTKGEEAVVIKEIRANNEQTGKTITLIKVTDLARLVRIVPLKRIGLEKLRDLFLTCVSPEESAAWIDAAAAEKTEKAPYRQILDVIDAEQTENPEAVVEYAAVVTALRTSHTLKIKKDEVADYCRAMERMAPGLVSARKNSVEITQRVDKVLEAISAAVRLYPDDEQRFLKLEK